MNDAVQLAIICLSGAAIVLFSSGPRAQAAASALGLIGQPFWLYATGTAGQWGMFALACAYTWFWAAACWRLWFRPLLIRRRS